MIQKIKHYAKEIIYFTIFITIFANIISLYKSQSLNSSPLEIKEFTLLDSSKYTPPTSKPILIHFWATWCPTCKLEASNIQTLSEHFEVLTVAVNSGESYDIKQYMDENEYNYKVVNDSTTILSSSFNIVGLPTTFIYDKEKNLLFSEVGYSSTLSLYLKMLWAGK
ncbi:redoxin domain-containing protein [Sulfurimonas aquatica]|uniref:Redoxin domain-containing protein n=1 Tax=Sulfurimonas aquatica TaxID=2672570 RepID=A0A975B1J9_9BACT|nr:redoxin domain-containing protein [Sulfurimonas aquatica]QSZ42420.1 redoxin domain-containing protein [Sulfurimonas aquatica]